MTRGASSGLWTPSQRRVLIGSLCCLLVYLVGRYALHPVHISDPQPQQAPRAGELADRIDPNVADWQTLAALPALGEKRAKTIVTYRENFLRQHPHRRAFEEAEDLLFIHGIGPSMLETLRPFLFFPPTTGPTIRLPAGTGQGL